MFVASTAGFDLWTQDKKKSFTTSTCHPSHFPSVQLRLSRDALVTVARSRGVLAFFWANGTEDARTHALVTGPASQTSVVSDARSWAVQRALCLRAWQGTSELQEASAVGGLSRGRYIISMELRK